jgi:hypothetical protein
VLIAGMGSGVAVVTVSTAILAGTCDEETGMISGLNSTGREIGGPQAASGIGDAFPVAALVATLASGVAIAVLPRAEHFLPNCG